MAVKIPRLIPLLFTSRFGKQEPPKPAEPQRALDALGRELFDSEGKALFVRG